MLEVVAAWQPIDVAVELGLAMLQLAARGPTHLERKQKPPRAVRRVGVGLTQ
jgi:hypothetical protein